jgi:hypothetical protein
MIFLASLIFVLLFYLLPLHLYLESNFVLFPFLGKKLSFLPTSALIYLLILVFIYVIYFLHDFLWPDFSKYVKRINQRSGIFRLDGVVFLLSLASFFVFLAVDLNLIPLSLSCLIGFGSLAIAPIERQPVGIMRKVRLAPVPESKKRPSEKQVQSELVTNKFDWIMERPYLNPFVGHLELQINRLNYQDKIEKNPFKDSLPSLPNYKLFISQAVDLELLSLAGEMQKITAEENFSALEEIKNIFAFAKAITYKPDKQTKGHSYLRFPVETLMEKVADDDCKLILAASLAKVMGHPVIVIENRQQMAIGVGGAQGIPGRFINWQGERYYYCSVIDNQVSIGEIPADTAEDELKIYPV